MMSDFDFEMSGKLEIEANGNEDPLKDILDYDLKSTTSIFVRYPDGRVVSFIREDRAEWLDRIEKMVRDAFNSPETRDENLYRAQALAKIYQIFEYNGSTIERSGKDEQ
jgi:hypothetical protein